MYLRLPTLCSRTFSVVTLFLGFGMLCDPVMGGIIVAEHSGGNDPLTQGWTINGGIPTGLSVGSISESTAFGGLNAWYVDDDSSAGGSAVLYRQTLSNQQLADAQDFGWTLRANLRVVDVPDDPGTPGGSVRLRMSLVDRIFNLNIGSEADGDVIVSLTDRNGSDTIYVDNGGGNGYHLYELAFDPNSMRTSLWIDGTQRVSNYAGYAPVGTTGQEVLWGSGSSSDQGQGNYNLVQFELADVSNSAVPEPNSSIAFAVGVFCLINHRKRRYARIRPLCGMRK